MNAAVSPITTKRVSGCTTVQAVSANWAHPYARTSVAKRITVKDVTAISSQTTGILLGLARPATGTRTATLRKRTSTIGWSGVTAKNTAMLEADLERTIVDAAKLLGWRVAHFRPAQNSRGGWRTPVAYDGAGFPDLVLVRERLIVVELKSDKGRVSEKQQQWLDGFRDAGIETYVWRPGDLSDALTILQARKSATLAGSVEVVPSPLTAPDCVPFPEPSLIEDDK